MFLQVWYKYAGVFYYLTNQNLPKLLNKVNSTQNLSGFVFLWWITTFLSLEEPGLHKDPLGTVLSPRRERDSGDRAMQDSFWEKAQPSFVIGGSDSSFHVILHAVMMDKCINMYT